MHHLATSGCVLDNDNYNYFSTTLPFFVHFKPLQTARTSKIKKHQAFVFDYTMADVDDLPDPDVKVWFFGYYIRMQFSFLLVLKISTINAF